jgi:poly [ADP-ribose] polymerase
VKGIEREGLVMSKVANLIMVTAVNNNKYYNMIQEGDKIAVTYGRVDSTTQHASYPISRWNSLLKSKLKKGYKDVTNLRVIEKDVTNFQSIGDDIISKLVAELQAFANKSIQANYTVNSDAVTQKQVDEAQKLLDKLARLAARKKLPTIEFNDLLLDLYQVIPRRMGRVQNHLWDKNQDADRMVANEQATLDVMKGQVRVNTAQKDNKAENKRTILEAMGLEIVPATQTDIKTITKELGEISNKFRRAFKVVNKRTQKKFDNYVEKSKDKSRRLFWHGSRNENWWSILDGGLVLRPTNAVITGKMFGYGLYFADKARKSYGYTSCRGSYWARGSSNKGFMALYDVHLGNTLTKKKHESWMYSLTDKDLRKRGDYDSLSALGGADLRNNEFIVYNEAQCTVKYLVEIN